MIKPLALACAMSVCLALPGHAQGPLADFLAARELLQRAVATHGGPGALAQLTGLRIRLTGDITTPEQGLHASALEQGMDGPEPEAFRMEIDLDLQGERARSAQDQDLLGGLRVRFESGYRNGESWSAATHARTHTIDAGSFPAAVAGFRRFVPVLALRAAVEHLGTLRHRGASRRFENAEVVEFSWDESTRDLLHVRPSDGRLLGIEAVVPDRLIGADVALIQYRDWTRTADGLPHPRELTLERHWGTVMRLRAERYEVATAFASGTFDPPSASRPMASAAETVRIAEGVWELRGLGGGVYNTQFFDTGTGVVVFEAPVAVEATRHALAEIRRATGGKPVTHVVLSHFHADHTAGLRTYTDIGATVVVSPENVPAVHRLAAMALPLGGLTDRPLPGSPRILTVAAGDSLAIGSGPGRLLVHNLGALPHAESMLTLELPGQRIIVDGDLFSRISIFNETFAAFAEWLDRSGMGSHRVLGTHHEPIAAKELSELTRSWRRGQGSPG